MTDDQLVPSKREQFQQAQERLLELSGEVAEYLAIMIRIESEQLWIGSFDNFEQFVMLEKQRLSAINISRDRVHGRTMELIGDLLSGVPVTESHTRKIRLLASADQMREATQLALNLANLEKKPLAAIHCDVAAEMITQKAATGGYVQGVDGEMANVSDPNPTLQAAAVLALIEERKKRASKGRDAIMAGHVISIDRETRCVVLQIEDGDDPEQELKADQVYKIGFYKEKKK